MVGSKELKGISNNDHCVTDTFFLSLCLLLQWQTQKSKNHARLYLLIGNQSIAFFHALLTMEVLDVRISLLWLHQLFWLHHPRKHIQIFSKLDMFMWLMKSLWFFFCTVEVSRKFIFSAELSNISALSE